MSQTQRHMEWVFCGATLFDFPLEQKVEAAAAGGFSAITCWVHDYLGARERGLDDAGIRRMLADNGIRLAGIDCLLNWLPDEQPPDIPAFRSSENDIYRVADALGGEVINVAQAFSSQVDVSQATDVFADICERAATRGLAATLEFIPWAGIRDLATANRIVAGSGMSNARVALDFWHFFRGGSTFEELRATPASRLANIQLNDGPAQSWDSVVDEASERSLPGEGELPIRELIDELVAIGFAGPWGLEAPTARWNELDSREIGRQCGAAMRAMLSPTHTRPRKLGAAP